MNNPTATSRGKDEQRSPNTGQCENEVKNKVQQTVSGALDKAKETASSVAQKAKDAASSVAHSAHDLASSAGHKTGDAVSAIGSGMSSLAGTIREKAPHEGMLGTASCSVADSLESGGRYLREEGLSGMAEDAANLVRRNPIPSLLVGVGVGFLLARSLRS